MSAGYTSYKKIAEKISTFCRVCESACGLIAEREDNTVLSLCPDKSHPVSQGFAVDIEKI